MRAVSLAITLVSIVTFATVAYSAYSDYSGVIDISRAGTAAVTSKTVVQGTSATVYLNATIPNKGLLPIQVSIACSQNQSGITCLTANMTIGPGQVETVHFQMTIANFASLQSNPGGFHVNGTLKVELVPFASISASIDIGTLVHQGGA